MTASKKDTLRVIEGLSEEEKRHLCRHLMRHGYGHEHPLQGLLDRCELSDEVPGVVGLVIRPEIISARRRRSLPYVCPQLQADTTEGIHFLEAHMPGMERRTPDRNDVDLAAPFSAEVTYGPASIEYVDHIMRDFYGSIRADRDELAKADPEVLARIREAIESNYRRSLGEDEEGS